MHGVIETQTFIADVKRAGLPDEEREAIVNTIAAAPEAGDVMQGTGVVRKLRFAGRGKGKSGGFRVIYYAAGEDVPIFLFALFGKGEKADLTGAERNELKAITSRVAEAYRLGVTGRAVSRRR